MNIIYNLRRWPWLLIIIGLAKSSLLHATATTSPPPEKVKLLVVIDTSEPLVVDYRTTGNTIRSVLMVGGLLDIFISDLRESGHSKKLRETIGEFDRFPIVKAGVEGAFRQLMPYFDVTVTSDATLIKGKMRLDFDEVQNNTYDYALVLKEAFAGMLSVWRLSTLSAASTLRYELYDLAEKKSMIKGAINGWSPTIHDFDEGVSNRTAFMVEYAVAEGNAISVIYGQLNKGGHLHTMATKVGLGEFVPAIHKLLETYTKTFDLRLDAPRGWYEVDSGSKYSKILAPKNKDKALFAVRYDVDLLIKEFGQNVDDLESYVNIFTDKVLNMGYTRDSLAATGLKLNDQSITIIFNRPDKAGKEVVIFNRFSPLHAGIFTVVCLADYEGFMAKYENDVKLALAGVKVQTRD